MRSAFFGLILCVCSTVYAGQEASVLVSKPCENAQPAVVAAPACCDSCACATAAPTSTVRTRTRYRVVSEGCDACTGRSTRSVARGVVRGTGEVVRGVGEVAVGVITLPARVCRNGRCCN
jgi:hypothetical protein